ncbi:hypothetical protein MOSE0_L01464 [Monosporozyma servazzii]
MNPFDKFIEETDHELNVDTSSRKFSIGSRNKENRTKHESNGSIGTYSLSPRNSIISTTSNGKPFNIQRQLKPVRVHDLNDQPLKSPEQEEPSNSSTVTSPQLNLSTGLPRNRSSSRSMINKRRSLIQPIIPHSEHTNNSTHKDNTSASNTLSPYHVANKSMEQNVFVENSMLSLTESNVSYSSIDEVNRSAVIEKTNDVNELLKNLANKELELFESKQKIEELKKNLIYHEKLYEQHSNDLKQLKSKVSKHLSDKSSTINISTPTKTEPLQKQYIVESTPETPKSSEKNKSSQTFTNNTQKNSSLSPLRLRNRTSSSNQNKFKNEDIIVEDVPYIDAEPRSVAVHLNPTDHDMSTQKQPASNQNESVWSKPFSIFNQFDQILQKEIEKSLNWDNDTENETSFVEDEEEGEDTNQTMPFRVGKRITSQQQQHQQSTIPREPNLANPHSMNNPQLTKHLSNNGKSGLTRSVSTSLWGFVNEMKEGLLGTYASEDEDGQHSQDSTDINQNMKEFNTKKKIVSDNDGSVLRKRGGTSNNNSNVSIDEINKSVEMTYI